MTVRKLIRYILFALVVIIFGALAGWYFFLRSQTGITDALNAARGFGTQAPVGSPFGTGSGTDTGGGWTGSGTSTAATPPQLWHVSTTPAAGIGFATSSSGVRIRYAERSTGYVFEGNPVNGGIARLTNTLMPKLYEALFGSSGRVLARSFEDGAVTTFAGTVTVATSSSGSSFAGTALAKNITEAVFEPNGSQLAYLQTQGTGVVGMSAEWGSSKQKQFFASALPDWHLMWLSGGRIVLAQKAADDLAGYAYSLSGGVLRPLLGPLPGLTVLPKGSSSALLYGTSSGGTLSLFVQLSATTTATRLAIATVADKCAWAPGTTTIAYCGVPQTPPRPGFLGAWYRGEVHPSDAVWRIDAGAGQAQLIFTPDSSAALDIINPVVDETGSYIAFRNGADGSPWVLRLNK